jgi:hypothetical protein
MQQSRAKRGPAPLREPPEINKLFLDFTNYLNLRKPPVPEVEASRRSGASDDIEKLFNDFLNYQKQQNVAGKAGGFHDLNALFAAFAEKHAGQIEIVGPP